MLAIWYFLNWLSAIFPLIQIDLNGNI